MVVTLPVWISAAAALVTAAVTRLVAPVWSLGPHGDGGTSLVQSLCAPATDARPTTTTRRHAVNSALGFIDGTPFCSEGALPDVGPMYAPGPCFCQVACLMVAPRRDECVRQSSHGLCLTEGGSQIRSYTFCSSCSLAT